MAISSAPKKSIISTSEKQGDERKIIEVINRGGKTTKASSSKSGGKKLKGITIHLTEEELEQIYYLRDKRPKPRGRKLAISINNWIIEAVQEKIAEEYKKYKD